MHHIKKSVNKSGKHVAKTAPNSRKKNGTIMKNKKSNQSKVKRKSPSSTKNVPKSKTKSTKKSIAKSNKTHSAEKKKTAKKSVTATTVSVTNKNSKTPKSTAKRKIKNAKSKSITNKRSISMKNTKTISTRKKKENVKVTSKTTMKKTVPISPKSNKRKTSAAAAVVVVVKSPILPKPTKSTKSNSGKNATKLVAKKKPIKVVKQKQSKTTKKRRKLVGHRVASLNALAKVKLLCENGQNATVTMAGKQKLQHPSTNIKSGDDDDKNKNDFNVINSKSSSMKKVKRINTKSDAQHKSNTAYSSTSSSSVAISKKVMPVNASSTSSLKVKNLKNSTNKMKEKSTIKRKSTSVNNRSNNKNRVNKTKTKTTVVAKKKLKNNKKKKKKSIKLSIDPDVEIIDTRRNKRMANLNASAMMAATFSPEKERRLVLASAKPLLKSSTSDPHHQPSSSSTTNPQQIWSTTHHSSMVEEHIEMTTVKTTVKLRHDNTTVVETTTTTQQRIEQQQNLLNQSSDKKRKNKTTTNKKQSTSSKKRKTIKNNQMIGDATSPKSPSKSISTTLSSSSSNLPPPVTITETTLSPTISAFTPCPSGSSTPLIIPATHPPSSITTHPQGLDLIYQVPSHSHRFTSSQSSPVTGGTTCIDSTMINENSTMMAGKNKSQRSKKKQKSTPPIQSTTSSSTTNTIQPSNSSIMKKYYRKIETRTVEHQSSAATVPSNAAAISAAKVTTATTSNIIHQHDPRTNFYHHNTNAIAPPNGMMTFSSLSPYNAVVGGGGGGGSYMNPSLIKPYNPHSTLMPTTSNQPIGSNHTHSTPYSYPFSLSQSYGLYNPATVSTVPFQLIPFGNSGHVLEQPTPLTGGHPFISPQPFIAAPPPTIYPYINPSFTPAATPISAIGQFFQLPTATLHQPATATASPFLGVHYLAGSNSIGVALPPRHSTQPSSCHYQPPPTIPSSSSTSNQSYLNVFTGSRCTPSSSSSLSSNITNNQSDRIIYPVSIHHQSGQSPSSSSTSTSLTVDTTNTSMNTTRPSLIAHQSQPQIINLNGATNTGSIPSALNSIPNVIPYGFFRPQSSSTISIPVSTSSSSTATPISSSIRPSTLNFLNSNFIPPQQQTPTFFVHTRIQPPNLSSLKSTITMNSIKKKPMMMKSKSKTLKNTKNNQRKNASTNGVVDEDLLKQFDVDNKNGNVSDGSCHTGSMIMMNKKQTNKQLLSMENSRGKNTSNSGKSKRKTNLNSNSDHTIMANDYNNETTVVAGGRKFKSNLTIESNGKNLLLKNGIGTIATATATASSSSSSSPYPKRRNNLLPTTSITLVSASNSKNNSSNNNNSNSNDNDSGIESNEIVPPPITSTTTDNCEFRCVMGKRTNRKPIIHGWSWEGEPMEKNIFINNDEQSYRRKCYPAIKHNEGEIIRPGDCVLLKSGPRKTDLPFVAKITSLWESPEREMMMSLLWYYRPEHTDIQDIPFIMGEIYASRHRDANSVACIDDKCFVLTYNEYCRYKRQKCRKLQMFAFLQPDLTAMIVPNGEPWSSDENQSSNDQYQQQQQIINRFNRSVLRVGDNNRIPPLNTLPELVFCCRKVYDFRQKRILKNPSYERNERNKSSA
ncbi:uncharacterized protein LOC124493410 [Dermatophagoides farinae]|uniref:uncharacterized protein LOC124493410 n=1 Tax=Dermatophagoides farinae TaxID=6954 RepID=UPI003F5E42A9